MDVTSDQYPNLFWHATTSTLSRDHLHTDNRQFTNRKYHKHFLSTFLLGIPTRGGCKRTWNWLFHFFWHRFWPQITTFTMTTFTGNIAKLRTQNSLELFYPNPPYELPSQLGKTRWWNNICPTRRGQKTDGSQHQLLLHSGGHGIICGRKKT